MRKKIAVISLLFALWVPTFGMFLWLQYRKAVVRREVKARIIRATDRAAWVKLTFTQDQATRLKWEHDEEFEYQNQMYDVVSQEQRGDSLIYWCWWDHEESRLNRYLGHLTSLTLNGDPFQRQSRDQWVCFIQTLFLERPVPTMAESSWSKAYPPVALTRAGTPNLPPPTPPPRA